MISDAMQEGLPIVPLASNDSTHTLCSLPQSIEGQEVVIPYLKGRRYDHAKKLRGEMEQVEFQKFVGEGCKSVIQMIYLKPMII